jgi:signal transduction histidine kinase
MDRMTTSSDLVALARRLRANWPALLLPLLALEAWPLNWSATVRPGSLLSPLPTEESRVLLVLAVLLTLLLPRIAALIVPYVLFAYGCAGIFVLHSMLIGTWGATFYGVLKAWAPDGVTMLLVLPQALAFIAASLWLLTVTGAPGGATVRTAVQQLRGTGGQPRIVPPLLLLPVLFLWQEALSGSLWFPWSNGGGLQIVALLLLGLAIALLKWRPDLASITAVLGLIFFGLYIVYATFRWHDMSYGTFSDFYGPVLLTNRTAVFVVLEGIACVIAGVALTPRLLATFGTDVELVRQAQALTHRVTRLTQTRSDATETAVAELRRIERDLHDGAQARLVAVGMSLRAAEQLMAANPQAALALVAEARETSSRALADLRDLVRGIYPPVLADRGLADAVRAIALDAALPVDVHIDLPGEPPMPVAAAVYFAIAEALTNAVRHSDARTAHIEIGYVSRMIRATITDDGHGGADPSRGTGLSGVERRLATFDGILALSSPPGGPTIVAIEVPSDLSPSDPQPTRTIPLTHRSPRTEHSPE